MNRPTNRRRTLVVNRSLQGQMILQMFWPPATLLVLVSATLALFSRRLADEALQASVELPSLLPILVLVVGLLFGCLAFLIWHCLRLSHRIAGPMYRIHKTLEAVRNGDLTCRANLRKGDFLQETGGHVNEFLDWLEEHPPEGLLRPGSGSEAEEDVVDVDGVPGPLDQAVVVEREG